ncbi:Alpha/beta knot methyltransferase [Jackrogersella minutella]|nr:Alpha/beta knot methyltransferase [Jackrogersella minutella]
MYLYCGENRQDPATIVRLERQAEQAGIAVVKVFDSHGLRVMDKMSEGRPHNGCIIEASPIPQLPLKSLGAVVEEPARGFNVARAHQSLEEAQINGISDFIESSFPPNRKPFFLLLDQIQDPGNLGAILRSAAFLGVNAVGMTSTNSASLTSTAIKAAAGASEVLNLFNVVSILDFLTRSKEEGWVIYAAVAPTSRPRQSKHLMLDRLDSYDPLSTTPTILVVGSEGEGLTNKTKRMADYEVSIPNHSENPLMDSLNVSVATGILCSAFLKKQHTDGKFDNLFEINEDVSEDIIEDKSEDIVEDQSEDIVEDKPEDTPEDKPDVLII